MNILERIDKLQKSIKADSDPEEFEARWIDCKTITYEIDDNKRSSTYERQLVMRLQAGVTDVMAAIRDGLPSPNISGVGVVLTALRSSIEKRTTGPDGWPIK